MLNFIIRILVLVSILLTNLIPPNFIKPSKSTLDKIAIGIVETSGIYYRSKIHWYDENLEEIYTTTLPYAGLATHFVKPFKFKDELYMIPAGLGNMKDTMKVLSLNLKDLSINTYPFSNIGLNDVTVIDDNIYTVCTLPIDTYFERYNKLTKQNNIIILKDSYIYSMYASNNKIFAFTLKTVNEEDIPEINIFDKDLNLLKTISLSNYEQSTYKYYEDNNYIYTGLISKNNGLSHILKLNKNDYSLSIIEDVAYNPDAIYFYDNKFIVTDFDPVSSESDVVSILDKDGKLIDTKHIGNSLVLTAIYKDKFIVSDGENIFLYKMDNFELIKKKNIGIKDYSYTTAIITR